MSALWNSRFLKLATHISTWSKDPAAQVGAVIVDPKRRIVSVGFNGFPQGVHDDAEIINNRQDKTVKLLRTIHAEENAILFARRDLDGCSIYVSYPPCAKCAAKIIQVGITDVYSITPDAGFLANWKIELDQARSLFVEAAVRHSMLLGPFE